MLKQLPSQFIILNAKLFDGLGNAPCQADICVNQGRIEAIGKAGSMTPSGVFTLDATGLALAPGFIDAHSHSDTKIIDNPNADAKITQGVTTEVIGNCGSSATIAPHPLWQDIETYAEELNYRHPAVNIVALAGHNTIRSMVMGSDNREPTPEELRKMKNILVKALEQGAAGFSSGLWYLPGKYSKTPEVVELARALKGTGKPYATHLRSESDNLLDAIDEALEIAAAGDGKLQISHIKTTYQRNYWMFDAVVEKVRKAQASGLSVHADRYPYIFSCTGLRMILPKPYDMVSDLKGLLKDDAQRAEVIKALNDKTDLQLWSRVYVTDSIAAHADYLGCTLEDIAQKLDMTPGEATVKILHEGNAPQAAYGKMSEENMHKFLAQEWVVAGSDASANAYSYFVGRAHPRAWGTFPRFFQFARKSAPDEQVIKRMTSLTASIFNIPERGAVKRGYLADLVLFDPDTFQCAFDFKKPHTPCTGVRYVFVNGKLAFNSETPTLRGRHGSFIKIPNQN